MPRRWDLLLLVAVLGLSACDGGRARPGGPGTGATPAGRDAAPSGDASVITADEDASDDAGAGADREEPDPRVDGGAAFDALPAPDADPNQPPEDAAAPDAASVFDAMPLDAQTAPDAAAPDAAAPASDAAAPDAMVVPPPPDGGVRGDAGTPACTQDSQCASGRCHPLYGQCVPQTQRPLCDPCTTDSECGLPGDHCLDVSASGTFLERICAQACRASADCPRGYDCTLNGHCYPISGAIRVHTCSALRDMLARETCNAFTGPDTCGIPGYDDGTCVPTLGCTVGCDTPSDCPEQSACVTYVVTNYCVRQ